MLEIARTLKTIATKMENVRDLFHQEHSDCSCLSPVRGSDLFLFSCQRGSERVTANCYDSKFAAHCL